MVTTRTLTLIAGLLGKEALHLPVIVDLNPDWEAEDAQSHHCQPECLGHAGRSELHPGCINGRSATSTAPAQVNQHFFPDHMHAEDPSRTLNGRRKLLSPNTWSMLVSGFGT